MKNYTTTPKHNITHSQLLKLRGLNENEMENLISIYGSCIYEVLMRVDVLEFEVNDDNELFITHNHILFNDDEFNILIDDFESTSESDDNGVTYETQVIAD
jgi:hypothetical protein